MIVAITDSSLFSRDEDFFECVISLIESPVRYVILREKDWEPEYLVSFLLKLMGRSDQTCRKIVVHSHVTVARHLGLTYVHLPESRIAEEQKSHTQYSYALHNLEQLEVINSKHSLFNLISPVAQTDCKPGVTPIPEAMLQSALKLSKAPLVALGGIDVAMASSLKEMGVKHIALRSQVMTLSVDTALKPYVDMNFHKT